MRKLAAVLGIAAATSGMLGAAVFYHGAPAAHHAVADSDIFYHG